MDTIISQSMTPMQTVQPMRPRDYNGKQLALVKRTIAPDCDDQEFNLFVEVARRAGADLFRKHLYPVVYNKDDPAKRKMTIITSIDFFRATAHRNRDYRPDENEPQFEVDEARKGPSNPEGLVKATVNAYKFGPDRQWHKVPGVAYWTEFAPMKVEGDEGFEWIETGEVWPDSGNPKKRKVPKGNSIQVPDGKWATMPHIMLAKCAEAQALRKGWPEDLSGIYTSDEMDQAGMVDITASAEVELHEQEQRLHRIGAKDTIPLLWHLGDPIELVPVGDAHARIEQFARDAESPAELEHWRTVNQVGLREFWAVAKPDALDAKRIIEERIATLQAEAGSTDAA